MPRRGENIYKRKDGRWEGRLIRGHHPNGKAIYQYVYGKSYSEAKRKLLDLRSRRNVGADTVNQRVKYKDILNEWLIMSQIRTKESTFSHYTHLSKLHILPFLGEIPIEHLTTKIVEDHILMLLSSGRIDGTLPCLPLLDTAMATGMSQMELYCQLGALVCDRPEKGAAVAAPST